jgi:hypothetical protein
MKNTMPTLPGINREKENGKTRPIAYELSIALDNSERPFVLKERLRQKRIIRLFKNS